MTILIFLGVLLVLIIVHEFGHFIVAKKSGIRVDEFGIGFPPKLFGKKYGETEYSINAIPFGGFVRIFGEKADDMPAQAGESVSGPDSARALIHKPRIIQAAVLFAGVFFNILLAWVLFSTTLAVGIPTLSESLEHPSSQHLSQYLSDERLLITQILPDSPADKALLVRGDEIVSLTSDGDVFSMQNGEEVRAFINANSDKQISLEFRRDGVLNEVTLTPENGLVIDSLDTPAIGVGMGIVGNLQLPVHLAVWEGGKQTISMLYRVAVGIGTFLYDALLFKADLSTVAGPVGIVSLVGDASAIGFIVLLNFTAMISLNLAVINMIPFPALDGGRLFFLAIEAIKGSPIRPQIANAFNLIGFALLILLMIVVTYGDIVRLID